MTALTTDCHEKLVRGVTTDSPNKLVAATRKNIRKKSKKSEFKFFYKKDFVRRLSGQ